MSLLAILADIHGNLPALIAVENDLMQYNVDQVIVLGDLVNWGPFSLEVVEHVIKRKWSVIRGNNELYLVDSNTYRAPAAWESYTMLTWLRNQLKGYPHNIIASWPDTLCLRYPDGNLVRVYHGTPNDVSGEILPSTPEKKIKKELRDVSETTVLLAHTHIPLYRQVNRWTIINPGSVGSSLDGTITATYALLQTNELREWDVQFRKIPYDVTPVLREFTQQNFFEKVGAIGKLVVKEFETGHLYVIPFLKWKSQCYPEQEISDDLLLQFSEDQRRKFTPKEYIVDKPIN